MYRTRADDDQHPFVLASKDAGGIVAGGCDGESRRLGRCDLMPEQSRLDEGVILIEDM